MPNGDEFMRRFLVPIVIAGIIGAAAIQAQVLWHNKAIAGNDGTIAAHIDYDKNDHDAITKIKGDIEHIDETLERLEKKIDKNQEVILEAIKNGG